MLRDLLAGGLLSADYGRESLCELPYVEIQARVLTQVIVMQLGQVLSDELALLAAAVNLRVKAIKRGS